MAPRKHDWTRYSLRLPPDLYEKLVAAAGTSSINSEIVARLQASFDPGSEVAVPRPTLENRVAALEQQCADLERKLFMIIGPQPE